MSALIGNPLLLTTAPSAGDGDAYQIANSLRFNPDDNSYLTTKFKYAHDRKKWTWSGWIKTTKQQSGWWLIGQGNSYFQWVVDGNECWIRANFRTASTNIWWDSPRHLNDPTAWYHVVIAVDTTQSDNNNKVKLYINGELDSTSAGALGKNYMGTNGELLINKGEVDHYMGSNSNPNGSGTYLADVYFISGQQLYPAYWGKWDAAGSWNPIAFSHPSPNNGTTWSTDGTWSSESSLNGGSYPRIHMFNNGYNTYHEATNSNETMTWEPSSPIPIRNTLRLYLDVNGTHNNIIFNDGALELTYKDCADGWVDVPIQGVMTSLSKFSIKKGGSSYARVAAIEIDGRNLYDGKNEQNARVNGARANTRMAGYDYMSMLTTNSGGGTEGYWGNGPGHGHWKYYGFDGNTSNEVACAQDDKILYFRPPGGINYNASVEVMTSQNQTVTFNGTAVSNNPISGNGNWIELTGIDPQGSINEITFTSATTGQNDTGRFKGIRVDGVVLEQYMLQDNSFHLKFSDVTDPGWGEVMNTPTGALPMYGPGADDPDKGNLVLALSGRTLTDEHATIKGSGTNKALTNTSSAAINETEIHTKFYNKSLNFTSTDSRLNTADSDDFQMGTGDFTIEFWHLSMSGSGTQNLCQFISNGGSGDPYYGIYATDDTIKAYISGTELTLRDYIGKERWQHVAFTRSGSNIYLFMNGTLQASGTDSTNINGTGYQAYVGSHSSAGNSYNGYMNDFRVYKGKCKYTSSFVPPYRKDWKGVNFATEEDTTTIDWTDACTITGEGSWTSNYAPADGGLFDGSTGTGTGNYIAVGNGPSNRWMKCIFPSSHNGKDVRPIPYSTLKVYASWRNTQAIQVIYDGVQTGMSVSGNSAGSNSWITLSGWTAGKPIDGIRMGVENNNALDWHAIEIDGNILIDGGYVGAAQNKTGIGLDYLPDTPTNYGNDSTTGGTARGNYCVLNPLALNSDGVLSQGNLKLMAGSNNWKTCNGTFPMSSGKWYWEVEMIGSSDQQLGITNGCVDNNDDNDAVGNEAWAWVYQGNSGKTRHNNVEATYGSATAAGETIGVAFDADAGNLYFYKEGTIQNSGTAAFTGLTDGPYFPVVCPHGTTTGNWVNFGQRTYKYTNAGTNRPAASYKALCTQNLPDLFTGDNVNNPGKVFNIKSWTGTGASDLEVTGYGFKPDIIWTFRRTGGASGPRWYDVHRGATKVLYTDSSDAQATESGVDSIDDYGFTVGTHGNANAENDTHLGICWDAGTAQAATGTWGDNSKTYWRWTNAEAGLSIVKWVADNTTGTSGLKVPHGLAATPDMFIQNAYENNTNWDLGTTVIDGSHDGLRWNGTTVKWDDSNLISNDYIQNWGMDTDDNGVAYVWTSIPGYSKIGSYQGEGSTDGVFINTGFAPKMVIYKRTDAAEDWQMYTTVQNPYNPTNTRTKHNTSLNDHTGNGIDIMSSGFFITNSDSADNSNGVRYFFMAFAEYPFKTTRAR